MNVGEQKGFFSKLLSMSTPPEDIGTTGYLIDRLFDYTTALNIFYFVLVCLGIFGFTYLYHNKKHPKAYFTYGNKTKHIWVTSGIGLAVFLSIDLNITRMSNNDMLNTFWKWPTAEEKPLRVEVMAQQWMWHFRLAGADNIFNTPDDIVSPHTLTIPKGRKILARITSKDVIHSFYLPNFKVKIDAIPGRITQVWFESTKTGKYDVACAEMCGTHHYLMKGGLQILSEEDFKSWEVEAQKIALASNDTENLDSFWGWKWGNEE